MKSEIVQDSGGRQKGRLRVAILSTEPGQAQWLPLVGRIRWTLALSLVNVCAFQGGPMYDPQVSTLELVLRLNREEIRFWQQIFVQASFWFNAGAIGVAAYLVKLLKNDQGARTVAVAIVASIGLVLLCLGYQKTASLTESAVEVNWRDNEYVQAELRLQRIYSQAPEERDAQGKKIDTSTRDRIPTIPLAQASAAGEPVKGVPIDPTDKFPRFPPYLKHPKFAPEPGKVGLRLDWIDILRLLNVAVTMLAALIVWVYVPFRRQRTDQSAGERSPAESESEEAA